MVHVGTATTVPLRRLGALLRDARGAAGDDLGAVADRSDGRFDAIDLLAIEAGEYRLTDDEVGILLALYEADPGDLLAARSTLVIDLDEGTVAAGNWSASFAPGSDDPDDVLARYLALLYEMRGLEVGTPIPLRTLDVSVLSQALALPAPAVEERLEVLMVPGNRRLERARRLLDRRILVPAAGLVVAATAVGVLVFTPSVAEPATGGELGRAVGAVAVSPVVAPQPGTDIAPGAVDPSVQVAPPGVDTEPEIGEGLTIEREPQSAPAPPPQAPAPAPPSDEVELGGGLSIDAPPQTAPPGVDTEPEIGEGLTIERSDIEP
jgi:hypothetical protein